MNSFYLLFISYIIISLFYNVVVNTANIDDVVAFANKNWDCADISCSKTVTAGQGQPNYECAEFVARSLAAGGFVPNLHPLDSQDSYLNYKYDGVVYDLLWVSKKQGGPLGLEDFLLKLGWKTTNNTNVEAGYPLMLVGSGGPFSHTAIGVGAGLTNAHNVAHYHVPLSAYEGVNLIYVPPK